MIKNHPFRQLTVLRLLFTITQIEHTALKVHLILQKTMKIFTNLLCRAFVIIQAFYM